MHKIKFSVVSDIIFSFFCSFIICVLLLYYFIGRLYSMILSFWIALLVAVITAKILTDKYKIKMLTRKQEKECEDTLTALNFLSKKEVENVFFEGLQKANLNPQRLSGRILVEQKNQVYFFKFAFETVSKADIVKCFNKLNQKQTACICSETFSSEVIEFAHRFGKKIKLLDGKTCYKFLSENESLPKSVNFFEKDKKPSIKNNLLLRKNAKKFFLFGVLFCVMSFFVPIKLYYLISGGVMLIFSLILRLFGRREVLG